MELQTFIGELQAILKENESLKEQIKRYEIYIKKLVFDNNGIIKIKPFETSEAKRELESNYELGFGITSIHLIQKS